MSNPHGTFIHSDLDDAGLDSREFRVFCHILRRAGKGDAFPSGPSIAAKCRINKDTVWVILKALEDRGMISRESRIGQSTSYQPTLSSKWHPAENEGRVDAPSPAENEGRPLKQPGGKQGAGVGGKQGAGVGGKQGVLSVSTEVNPPKEEQSGQAASDPQPKPEPKKHPEHPSLEAWIEEAQRKYPWWLSRDAESAWNHYESNGWKVGKNQVKKWKSTIVTCHHRWSESHPAAEKEWKRRTPIEAPIRNTNGPKPLTREQYLEISKGDSLEL